ncbi:MAG: hypothetical protein K6F94_09415 [Bacteroidaceae bacterium]|nr:hypothetical protein [Bacteroidaceae bacterium]
MNIKIKSAGVSCLIGDDYDRVYTALKKQFGVGDEQLFTERTPGHEYLQWELPGEGWTSLADGDPIMRQEVTDEWHRRMNAVASRFASNQQMGQRILTVPDESYVYYKADESGHLLIRLTAWGYRYPERISKGAASGSVAPKTQTEHVVIELLYDGQPAANHDFRLNGYRRQTDNEGTADLGDLPIGYEFDVEADAARQHVAVLPGQGKIQIDITTFTRVQINATLNGLPYVGASVRVQYKGRDLTLTTNEMGVCVTTLPIDPEAGLCSASLDNESQQKPLISGENTFTFSITKEEEQAEEEAPEEKKEDETVKEEEKANRIFRPVIEVVNKEGKICKQFPIKVIINGVTASYVTDAQGRVHLQPVPEGQPMTVADGFNGETTQMFDLDADQEVYIFQLPFVSVESVLDITVTVYGEGDKPLSGATAHFSQPGAPNTLAYLDENGQTHISHKDYKAGTPATLTLTVGQEQLTPIEFELDDEEDEYSFYLYHSPTLLTRILEVLGAIGIAALVACTYLIGGALLFE